MIDLNMVVRGASLAISVGKYTGIIQNDLSVKLDQLAGSELIAGVMALRQAATSQCEHISLLREARARFNKATGLESKERLAAAYLGLALCHAHLGDVANAEAAVKTLSTIPTIPMSTVAEIGKVVDEWPEWLQFTPFVGIPLALASSAGRESELDRTRSNDALAGIKAAAQDLLERSLREGAERVFGAVDS